MPPQRGVKRKTASVGDAAAASAASAPSSSKKPRRPAAKPLAEKHDGSLVIPDIVWPPHFKDLERVHRALNLVYTFCCTRKHLATTFQTLKSSVEGHTKKELTVSDIAQIKFLIPRSVHFEYVDEDALQLHVMGSERDRDAYEPTNREVLLFEFIDGDLRRTVVKRLNEASAPAYRKLKDEDLKMPTFTTAQMKKLIEKRNKKFQSAVNAFLNECAAGGADPVESIKAQYHPHVPEPALKPDSLPATTLPLEIPAERKSIPEIVEELKTSDLYVDQIVPEGHRVFPPQEPVYGDLTFPLSQTLVNALYTAHNITKLYSHQAEAINNLAEGHHVIVSTSTSSGKSLIYQIPVLHELEKDRSTRAMYIFPTKALAQDQKRSLLDVLEYMSLGVMVDTFDGDTPKEDRRRIRDDASVIFTNPDMLHLNILPNEDSWRIFLKNLKFVVVDELHVYNGLFGSHVAYIMRRLRRICSALGNNKVKFVSCSATVANPEEHMRTIFGVDNVKLTDEDGSPAGRKEFICWNTPYKDPHDPSSGRGDCIAESARVFVQLILRGVRAIAFCRVRKVCENLLLSIRSELKRIERPEVTERVMAYRGGYSAQDRRKIEKEMFEGRLMGIVATNALELGVDIGSLDAVVMVGFPYNISNLRQQSGRAGRRNKDSLSLLVGGSYPVDQYYMSNPDEIFTKANTQLQVDLDGMLIREGHIQCAAFEMPIKPDDDRKWFGDDLPTLAQDRLERDGEFYFTHQRFRPYPSQFVKIRDTEEDHIAVIDVTNGRNAVVEEVEPSRVFFTLYEGGIFLHQGRKYIVREFNHDKRMALIEHVNVDWTTSQRDFTDVDPVETELVRSLAGTSTKAFFGSIRITSVVFGFFKVDNRGRILDAVEVDNPPLLIDAKGFWIDVPNQALGILKSRNMNIAAAIHSAEHAVMSLMSAFVVGHVDGDVRTECKAPQKEFMKRETARKRPARLTFYDAKGGSCGSGLSAKAFEFVDELLKQAVERITQCKCGEGCVECTVSEKCKEGNAVMSKAGARVVLRCIMGMKVDIDALPMGEKAGIETVVPAQFVGGSQIKTFKAEEPEAENA